MSRVKYILNSSFLILHFHFTYEVMKADGWRIFSALFMLLAGTGLSIAGFVMPPVGEISDSVLMFTAQALVYAGSAFGIDIMIDNRIRRAQHQEKS